MNFKRTMVIGSPGSGKTTFSLKLAKILERQVTHLDRILWRENWTLPTLEEREEIHNTLIEGDHWFLDGMWRTLVVDRLKRATAVIFLDFKRRISLFRAVKRFFVFRKKQRSDIAEGCLDKLDKEFLSYVWRFNKDVRPFLLELLNKSDGIDVVVLKSPKEARIFLEKIQQGTR